MVGETQYCIFEKFPAESKQKIKIVIRETYALEQQCKKYNGVRKEKEYRGLHLIEDGYVHGRMGCDLIETGLDLAHTTMLLNKELMKDNKEEMVSVVCKNLIFHLNQILYK